MLDKTVQYEYACYILAEKTLFLIVVSLTVLL